MRAGTPWESPTQQPVAEQGRVHQYRLGTARLPPLPHDETHQGEPAGEEQPDHGRETEPDRRLRLGDDEAPDPRSEDPEDDEPETRRRQQRAHEVKVRRVIWRYVHHPPGR